MPTSCANTWELVDFGSFYQEVGRASGEGRLGKHYAAAILEQLRVLGSNFSSAALLFSSLALIVMLNATAKRIRYGWCHCHGVGSPSGSDSSMVIILFLVIFFLLFRDENLSHKTNKIAAAHRDEVLLDVDCS